MAELGLVQVSQLVGCEGVNVILSCTSPPPPVPSAGVRWLSLGVPPSLQLASKHPLCASTAVWAELPTLWCCQFCVGDKTCKQNTKQAEVTGRRHNAEWALVADGSRLSVLALPFRRSSHEVQTCFGTDQQSLWFSAAERELQRFGGITMFGLCLGQGCPGRWRMDQVTFFLVFLAPGIFWLLSRWIIILPKKLISWETAGNGLGQGLCRSCGENGEDIAGEGDTCQAAGVIPFAGGGRRASTSRGFEAKSGGSEGAKFLRAPLLLVPAGYEGKVGWQGLAFVNQQGLGS